MCVWWLRILKIIINRKEKYFQTNTLQRNNDQEFRIIQTELCKDFQAVIGGNRDLFCYKRNGSMRISKLASQKIFSFIRSES